MEHFLATGNLISRSSLDLMQTAGYTIVADKLNNHRYLSHFRSIHRGQYFAEMKTTTVRKLLPESWGFLCPVHTPDGHPCGLLNHFAAACNIITDGPDSPPDTEAALMQVLATLGMTPCAPALTPPSPPTYLPVLVDGKVAGHVRASGSTTLVARFEREEGEGENWWRKLTWGENTLQ